MVLGSRSRAYLERAGLGSLLKSSVIIGGSCCLLQKQFPVTVGLSGLLLSFRSPVLRPARVADGLAPLHPGT